MAVVAGIAGLITAALFRPHLTPVERGRRLAEANGCFACHGPEGIRGAANPGRADRTVPNFEGTLMMYASNAAEVREWIENGVTARRAQSETWKQERDKGAVRMPAFGSRLSKRQIDDLVAFVLAAAGEPPPGDSRAQAGRDRAEALGCVGCHGPGGSLRAAQSRLAQRLVPQWDGEDLPIWCRSEAGSRVGGARR